MKRTVSIMLAVTLAATSAVGCGKRRTYKPMLWLAVRLRLPQQRPERERNPAYGSVGGGKSGRPGAGWGGKRI